MQVFLFKGPGRVFGFSTDPSGADLPPRYAPWSAFKSVHMQRGQAMPGVDVDECLGDIERFGVHVTDAHARITEAALSANDAT
jgi:hypothetical protein